MDKTTESKPCYFCTYTFNEFQNAIIEWRKKDFIPVNINIIYVNKHPQAISCLFVQFSHIN